MAESIEDSELLDLQTENESSENIVSSEVTMSERGRTNWRKSSFRFFKSGKV